MMDTSLRRGRGRLAGLCLAVAIAATALVTLPPPSSAEALDNGLAPTPPMGYNTWNQFYCNNGGGLTATALKKVADDIVNRGLKDVGYEYVVLDDCFQDGRDENGVMKVKADRFPDGIKPVADYIHSKGLKFGIYSVPGDKTCANLFNNPKYSPNIGSYGHERIDAETFASWGVDYLKYDWCYPDGSLGLQKVPAFSKMRDELARVDRDIVYAISEYGDSQPWTWGKDVANLWRTTGDIAANWNSVTSIINRQVDLYPHSGPGHWNDPDMLQFGNGSLTYTQNKSHLAMWSMLAAPLFLGTDISRLSNDLVGLLTNPEMVAIDQDALGKQARRISESNGLQVWTRPLANGDTAVALFNSTGADATISTSLSALGVDGVHVARDVWAKKNVFNTANSISATVPAYDTIVYRLAAGSDSSLPGIVGASGTGRVEAGGTATVDIDVVNLLSTPVTGGRIDLSAAGGLTPTASVTVPTVPAGGSVKVQVQVAAAANATAAIVSLPAQFSWNGGQSAASVTVRVTPTAPTADTHLSDLPWLATTNGWTGDPKRDRSQDGNALKVNGVTYTKGIGSNAVSTVDIWLGGRCSTLTGSLGVDDETRGGNGTKSPSIDGTIAGDGKALWRNDGIIRYQQKQDFVVDVSGVDTLRLTAGNGDGDNAYDHADWLNMAVKCAPAVTAPTAEASVTTRCVAGKSVLAVRLLNTDDAALAATVKSEYGTKTFSKVDVGASVTQVFSTRRGQIPAGTVSVDVTDPATGTKATVTADYAAATC
ncbi:NPCBM/NEW2 domain-containing protein [Microbacterium dextranolyticum]|uniref:Alpha-galactosidase n=1 Tax=Microbacterium dextranolyticum TaxID=36806 RepID=A0A9W6HLC6_9MICO|nr:alpha-galactosidase [Microbacterium dextranolyticum]